MCYIVPGSPEQVARSLATVIEDNYDVRAGVVSLLGSKQKDLKALYATFFVPTENFRRNVPIRVTKPNGERHSYLVATNGDFNIRNKVKSVVISDMNARRYAPRGVDIGKLLEEAGYQVEEEVEL